MATLNNYQFKEKQINVLTNSVWLLGFPALSIFVPTKAILG